MDCRPAQGPHRRHQRARQRIDVHDLAAARAPLLTPVNLAITFRSAARVLNRAMARSVVRAIVSLGCVSGLTVGGQAVTQKAIARIPTHAIRGAVKAISAFYVVIVTGSGKKAR